MFLRIGLKLFLVLLPLTALAEFVMEGTDPRIKTMRRPPEGSKFFAYFEGKVPCSGCNALKMALTLHRSNKDKSPGQFLLERVRVGQSNNRHVCSGLWHTQTSKKYKLETIKLGDDCPAEFRLFLNLDNKVLLLLDKDGEPRVGTPQHAYTLSRYDEGMNENKN